MTMQEAGNKAHDCERRSRGGKENLRKRRERKKGKAAMVSCSHTNARQVFPGGVHHTFLEENKCKEPNGNW